jgi:N-methylhydantoinase B
MNAVRAIALSAVNYVFRCLGPADMPSNAGLMRPIEVRTRPGSIVDAAPPAAVAGGNVETSQRIVDVVLGALGQAMPGVIPAASCGSMNNLTIGGGDPRRGGEPFAYYETIAGGAGAGPGGNGQAAVHTHMTNTLNTPIEALEHAYPFRVVRYAIRAGSGGAGEHRGGDGVERVYEFGGPVEVTLLTERRTRGPWAVGGAEPGAPGRNAATHSDGKIEPLPGKCHVKLQSGDRLQIQTPAGGGWSDGKQR